MATVPATPRTNTITLASDSAGPFLVGFRLFDSDGLAVYVNGELTTDYTVSATFLNGYDDTATITFSASKITGDVIVIDGDMTPARVADYLNGPGLVDLINIEQGRAWAVLSELKMRLDRAALGLDPALTLEDVQNIVAAAGSVPAPTVGQTGYLMQATGAGTYGWISRLVALGAALEAMRTLTPAADRMAYFTGASGAALATLTAFARSLLDDGDAVTARATLGVAIGTNVQAFNAMLASLAALTDPNADRIAFWDDSAGDLKWLSVSGDLSISGTTLAVKSNRLTFSAVQDTNGLTNVDFSGIPTGVNEIIVGFMGTSCTTTAQLLVQFMMAGTPITSGYTNTAGLTTGFSLPSLTAGQSGYGTMRLYKNASNGWTMDSGASGTSGIREVDFGNPDGIRLVHSAGNFDATGYGRAWIAWRD